MSAEEYLEELGLEDILFTTSKRENKYMSDLIKDYAKAKLEEAAKNAETKLSEDGSYWIVDKQSITNTPLD